MRWGKNCAKWQYFFWISGFSDGFMYLLHFGAIGVDTRSSRGFPGGFEPPTWFNKKRLKLFFFFLTILRIFRYDKVLKLCYDGSRGRPLGVSGHWSALRRPKWPKYSKKWWKMAKNLHDQKDTKIERKSNKKVIKVIELDLLNCPSMFPSFTRFIWPLRYPKNGEKWSKTMFFTNPTRLPKWHI